MADLNPEPHSGAKFKGPNEFRASGNPLPRISNPPPHLVLNIPIGNILYWGGGLNIREGD